jgi:putative heme iron utilization protein
MLKDPRKERKMEFEARKLVRACQSGSLATTDREDGSPYVSLCAYASDFAGNLIFLLSDLADHTKNIAKESRVSFLCEQASHLSNPQAGPRVTLVGKVDKMDAEDASSIFTQIHPSAKMYAGFGDFNFYRLTVEKAHYVGGFGKAVWINAADYLGDSAASLNFSKKQLELIRHLNADFPDFPLTCATKLLKQRGKNWQVLRVDGDGVDLKLASRIVRYPFENEIKNEDELRDLVSRICA